MYWRYEYEKVKKGLVYIQGNKNWWKIPASKEDIKVSGEPYIIDMTPRLDDGHYIAEWFDKDGIPRRIIDGKLVYNLTRVCGYGLANYDRYLQTAGNEYLEKFMKVAHWLVKNGEQGRQGFFVPYRYATQGRPYGRNSALSHGEILSIFARAMTIEPSKHWQELSVSALQHYTKYIEDGGIKSEFSEIGFDWFEEACHEKSHILNGYVYSVEGLWDLNRQFQNQQAKKLYDNAIDALEASLPLFDSSYWSYYHCMPGKPRYLASYQYHVMHCIMLKSLVKRHPERSKIIQYQVKWDQYLNSFFCRIKAMIRMTKQKVYNES